MTRFLTTAALATALTAPLAAQAQMVDMAELIRTRDITGGPVYSMGTNYDETMWNDETRWGDGANGSWDAVDWNNDGYNQIGEIEDVVLDRSGQMVGIVAEVGGFLDIGDSHVMVPVNDLRLVPVDDTSYTYITRLTEEQLEQLPEVDESWMD
ncbi:PRC-barrel domain-containing protein [Jannaschia formosa]|uniref:PRC-barrel domain-containing protein n=1 Tax=Jannaschia formosa TaxID=2259592 RepID=UPI000E1B7FBA|nr:PRC-barrel domain-containing protein [Jannaschia formosa]TFL19746.1 PRC-barrel domain containing protein [Jannaschia formosa]